MQYKYKFPLTMAALLFLGAIYGCAKHAEPQAQAQNEAAPDQAWQEDEEWTEYLSFDDLFSVNFPGDPAITASTYVTEHELKLPARVYTAKDFMGTYSVTAVDWSSAEQEHKRMYEECEAQTAQGGENPNICGNRYRAEVNGAALDAVAKVMYRGGHVQYLQEGGAEGVAGYRAHILNADGSMTVVATGFHMNRLFIFEGTTLKDMPPAVNFLVSFGVIDEEGRRIRYQGTYSPFAPPPPRSR